MPAAEKPIFFLIKMRLGRRVKEAAFDRLSIDSK